MLESNPLKSIMLVGRLAVDLLVLFGKRTKCDVLRGPRLRPATLSLLLVVVVVVVIMLSLLLLLLVVVC